MAAGIAEKLKLVNGRGTDEDKGILDAELGLRALDTKFLPTTDETKINLRSISRNNEVECRFIPRI